MLYFTSLDSLFKPERTGVKTNARDTILAILLGLPGFKFICQLSKGFALTSVSDGLFSTCMCFLVLAPPSTQVHPSEAQSDRL